jgi:AcrR family transcriptional regulator
MHPTLSRLTLALIVALSLPGIALAQASEAGFESLTIGTLADRAGLSKSGLFAHFGSREELQVAAIEAAAARFTETVFLPALKARRGLPRLRALFDHWLDWTVRSGLTHGCPMQSAAVEFDDRPGPVRDAVVEHFARLERELGRAVELAVGQGHLRPTRRRAIRVRHDGHHFRVPPRRTPVRRDKGGIARPRCLRAAGCRCFAECLTTPGDLHERLTYLVHK